MQTRKRLISTFLAGGTGQVLTTFIQLAGVPLYLNAWGPNKYGEWLLLSAIPAYLLLADLGLTSATGNKLAMLAHSGDRRAANSSFQTGLAFICAICTILVVFAGIVFFFPAVQYASLLQQPDQAAALALLILAVALQIICNFLTIGYRAADALAEALNVFSLIRLVEFLLIATALSLNGDFTVIAACSLFSRLACVAVLLIGVKRKLPWLRFGFRGASTSEMREIGRPSLAFAVVPLSTATNLQGTLLLLGLYFSPTAVTMFSTTRTMSRLGIQLLSSVNGAVWPELSRAFANSDIAKARALHRLALGSAIWFTVLSIPLNLLFAGWLYSLWTGNHLELNLLTYILLLLAASLNSIWSASAVVATSTNRHTAITTQYLVANLVGIGSLYFLLPATGHFATPVVLLAIEFTALVMACRTALVMTQDSLAALARSSLCNPFKILTRARGHN